MNKLSKRLLILASFVDKEDSIVDVGCDHGLLSIYLSENNLCQNIIASDINKNALNNAKENIAKKKLDIPTILSDGLNNIDTTNINTLIISGMGTGTIIHILNNKDKIKNISKIIIQSNNNHDILRKYMNSINYYLSDEKTIYDKGKWYITCLFIKRNKKNTNEEIEYGYLNNQEHINYLIDKYTNIIKSIPKSSMNDKKTLQQKINYLKETTKFLK